MNWRKCCSAGTDPRELRILGQWVFNEFFAKDFVQYRLGDGRVEQAQAEPPIKTMCEDG